MICANEGCEEEFYKSTHNQKYCSDECCRDATNRKIREKYYEERARLSGKKRSCSTRGCKNMLSRYNETTICAECVAGQEAKNKNDLLRMFNVSR